MNKPLVLGALIALSAACQNDTQQLLSTIDGRWQINSITYLTRLGRDSTVTPTAVGLEFTRCSKATNDRGPSNCAAEYREGNQSFRFAYQAPNGNKSLSISPINPVIDPIYQRITDRLAGSYTVKQLTANSLIIRRSVSGNAGGDQVIEYSASK